MNSLPVTLSALPRYRPSASTRQVVVSVSILSEGITTVFLFTIDEVLGFQFLTKRAQLFSSQNSGLPRTADAKHRDDGGASALLA